MTLDGLRGYLQLATGVTEVTRERATAMARALLAQGESSIGTVLPGPLRSQVAALTEDLVATSRANRDLLVMVVRAEVERSVTRLGLVAAEDLDAANRRARGLEARVSELEQELVHRQRAVPTRRVARAGTEGKATAAGSTRRLAAKAAAGKKSAAARTAATGTGASTRAGGASSPARKTRSPRTQ